MFTILFLVSVFAMLNFALTGILLGRGKTKVSLVLLIGVNFLNVVFNYILIFGVGPIPALGVAGAALGTIIARGAGSLAGLWIVKTPLFPIQVNYRDGLALDFLLLRKILYLGGPRSLRGIVRNFSRLMTIRIITLLPDATRAVSAYSVGMQVRMISTFIGLAFMSASIGTVGVWRRLLQSRVGQSMGGTDSDLAEKSGWISAAMATVLMSILALIFFTFPDNIMAFFTDDKDVIAMGHIFFVIIALTEPIMSFAFALGLAEK